jgi:hypothetical protein
VLNISLDVMQMSLDQDVKKLKLHVQIMQAFWLVQMPLPMVNVIGMLR